jgi:hypothetical protein
MIILVILHWITFQKQSKEIKRLQLLIKLHNEHMKTAIQEAEEAHTKFNRRESLQKEIKSKLDGNK